VGIIACRAAALIGLALLALPLVTYAATTATITVKDFAFQPKTVTIRVGDSVTWANVDTATHTVTSNGNWDTGGFAPGTSRSITFGTAGTYQYFCNLHSIMFGTVVVLASDAPAPTATIAPAASASIATGPPSTAPTAAALAALPSSTAAPVVLHPPSEAGPGPVIVAGAAIAIVALFALAWRVSRQV
jgi:plastocyanin